MSPEKAGCRARLWKRWRTDAGDSGDFGLFPSPFGLQRHPDSCSRSGQCSVMGNLGMHSNVMGQSSLSRMGIHSQTGLGAGFTGRPDSGHRDPAAAASAPRGMNTHRSAPRLHPRTVQKLPERERERKTGGQAKGGGGEVGRAGR